MSSRRGAPRPAAHSASSSAPSRVRSGSEYTPRTFQSPSASSGWLEPPREGNLLVFEGEGKVTEYVGGYHDWVAGGGSFAALAEAATKANPTAKVDKTAKATAVVDKTLSFEDRKKEKAGRQKLERELAQIPGQIDKLESEITGLQEKIAAPAFFEASTSQQEQLYGQLATKESALDALLERWEALEQN